MKKKILYIILISILLVSSLLVIFLHRNTGVQQLVNGEYETSKGLIKNYAKESDVQYLSESVGQYLYYLLLVEDEKEFKQQVKGLRKNFLVEKSDGTFIKWLANSETTTNASVDDFRVIEVLREASIQFLEPTYLKLANELEETLNSTQLTNGIVVDFYDWELQKKTNTFHLSYTNYQAIKENSKVDQAAYQKIFLESIELDTPFFREIYDVDKQVYLSAAEKSVNMIDQLMIAIQYLNFTKQVPKVFDQWLKEEWDKTGKIYGRYLKEDFTQAVPYESSAVYALATLYFKLSHEVTYSDQMYTMLLNQPTFESNPDHSTIHFFDYMWSKTIEVLHEKNRL